ncbi:MAG: C4-dicarboxylate transporter DcuC [Ruminococcus sp.]|nr:C4-dicarboxylate transporter DcuC [Ruminococcus sp.]
MTILMYVITIVAIGLIVFMLLKKMDITISMFLIGLVLMFIAIFMGNDIAIKGFESTGALWLDPFKALVEQFKSMMTSSGFIILILGGYAAYMSSIGANQVTVSVLTKPIMKIKSVYILVPVIFLLGNMLSLVIPSASNLAIILLATLYPVMVKAGMSPLTAAGVIATTATIIPTPLGSDNVAIAAELATTPEFAGLTVSDYVFNYHALISLPTLIIIAVVHYFWQKFMDKRSKNNADEDSDALVENTKKIPDEPDVKGFMRFVYFLLPLLPIILMIVVFILAKFGINISVGVEVVSVISFFIAMLCEMIRNKNVKKGLDGSAEFFKGMGGAMPIVALLVAATVFVVGLKSIGLITELQSIMSNMQGNGLGFVLPLIMVIFTALIVLLSGSGTSLFFAMVPLMVPLAGAAGISVLALSVPMGLAGNLLRAVSPVAAVVMIVAGTVKRPPLEIVKRTSVPMIVGTIFMFVFSMIVFL